MRTKSIGLYAVAATLSVSGAAFAQSRPSTLDMTCAQAHGAVTSAGVLVLGTGGMSYDRFVSGQRFCTFQEMATPAWAPTRDNARCFIGYVCESVAGRDPTPN